MGRQMAKRDLKLNSLSRYSKTSPNFVLEEHAHCEVPAGCGGVVLRWTNPDRAVPVELWFFTTGHAKVYIDGAPPKSGRPMIKYGNHVIACDVSQFAAESALLIFAGVYDEDKNVLTKVTPKTGNKIYILSSDDGSWKYTTEKPRDDVWMRPGYDDSDWLTMLSRELPRVEKDWRISYRVEKATRFGAVALGISTSAAHVWIRKAFSLTRP
jgi:hypothetical protein